MEDKSKSLNEFDSLEDSYESDCTDESTITGGVSNDGETFNELNMLDDKNNNSNELDVDKILYLGEISIDGYNQITKICNDLKKFGRKKAQLYLCTYGGNPHAGFRIARALQHHYEDGFEVVIVSDCKSAGTLVCLGAKNIIMADKGELGPLDIQLSKATELFERTSGLDLPQSVSALTQNVKSMLKDLLIEMRMGGQLSTKIASEMATNVTTGVFSPIFAQIDPLRLGELHRATMIAFEYGRRLAEKSDNLKDGALAKLISAYPAHSFVIDRKEAKILFKNVSKPSIDELQLLDWIDETANEHLPSNKPIVCFPLNLPGTDQQSVNNSDAEVSCNE